MLRHMARCGLQTRQAAAWRGISSGRFVQSKAADDDRAEEGDPYETAEKMAQSALNREGESSGVFASVPTKVENYVMVENVPHFASREDIKYMFRDLGVTSEQMFRKVGDDSVTLTWFVRFPTNIKANQALQNGRRRIGNRIVAIQPVQQDLVDAQLSHLSRLEPRQFGRAILIRKMPENASEYDIESLLEPYDPRHIRISKKTEPAPGPCHLLSRRGRAACGEGDAQRVSREEYRGRRSGVAAD
mmetsp:Transcript_8369/g.25156  ORF Transcript_8369/g.25156 Transcript_8369/m.25156 type:complete len:245 (+) Transcript_8369:282-1016(+)